MQAGPQAGPQFFGTKQDPGLQLFRAAGGVRPRAGMVPLHCDVTPTDLTRRRGTVTSDPMIHRLLRSAPAQSPGPRSDDDAPAPPGRAGPHPLQGITQGRRRWAAPARHSSVAACCLAPIVADSAPVDPPPRPPAVTGPPGRSGHDAQEVRTEPVSRPRVTESTVTVTARSRIFALIGLRRHKFGL